MIKLVVFLSRLLFLQEKKKMFDELCELIKAEKLHPPKCEIRSLEEGSAVLEKAHAVFGMKQLFKM